MLLNVLDFPSVAAALAAAQDGDRVYFPGTGSPYPVPPGTPASGWIVNRSLELFGDGPGSSSSTLGTILVAQPGSGNHVLTLDASAAQPDAGGLRSLANVYIHDLRILGSTTPTAKDGGSAIRFNSAEANKLDQFRLERVAISQMAGIGIDLEGAASPLYDSAINHVAISNVEVVDCGLAGCKLGSVYLVEVASTSFVRNGKQGVFATAPSGGSISFRGCRFEANRQLTNASDPLSADLTISKYGGLHIDACSFLNFLTTAGPGMSGTIGVACMLDGIVGGAIVSGCRFEQRITTGGVGVQLQDASGPIGGVQILPNRFLGVGKAIDAQGDPLVPIGANGVVVFPQFCDPASTPIALPTGTSRGTFGGASINGPTSHPLGGLLIPAYDDDPTLGVLGSSVQRGMLVLVNRGNSPKLKVLTDAGWKVVNLL